VKQPWVAHSESISDYNVVKLVNTKLNSTESRICYGSWLWRSATPALTIWTLVVSLLLLLHSLAFPVNSIFSNAETLIPLGMMGGSRIQFTTDSLINCFGSITNISASSLQNLELVLWYVDFGGWMLLPRGMADQNGILIKSQSFSNTTLSLLLLLVILN
jgi:hypothetical protein